MGIKEYFSSDLKTTLAYSLLGIAAGYASFAVNNPKTAFVLMLAVLAASTAAMKFALKVPSYRWFLSNGVVAFLFVWFVVWTIFYNLSAVV